jgi:hypothetical protein
MKRLLLFGLILGVLVVGIAPVAVKAGDPCRDAQGNEICKQFQARDGRLNASDATASMTLYCESDHSITVYAVVNSEGVYLYNVTPQQLADGVATAASTHNNTLITDVNGKQLYALEPGDKLEAFNTSDSYTFIFPSDACGTLPQGVAGAQPTTSTNTQSPNTSTQPISPASAKGTAVTVAQLSLRAAATKYSRRIAVIPAKTTVQVWGTDSSWLWIKITFNGKTGWLYTYYTSLRDTDLSALPILASSVVANTSQQ